jgi:hypothetical protein
MSPKFKRLFNRRELSLLFVTGLAGFLFFDFFAILIHAAPILLILLGVSFVACLLGLRDDLREAVQ